MKVPFNPNVSMNSALVTVGFIILSSTSSTSPSAVILKADFASISRHDNYVGNGVLPSFHNNPLEHLMESEILRPPSPLHSSIPFLHHLPL